MLLCVRAGRELAIKLRVIGTCKKIKNISTNVANKEEL